MRIFDIPIDNLYRAELLARLGYFLDTPKFHRIATVNPEFLLLARENPRFKEALLAADLCVVDGVGLNIAFFRHGEKLKSRFPGADLLLSICELAVTKKLTVFLSLYEQGLSNNQEIRQALVTRYPKLIITDDIRTAHIILCNFGAPLQEIHLSSLAANPGLVRLAMGIGGTFDYLTGKRRRAPCFLRTVGLEWFWRFLIEPKRWKKAWNAVIVFPFHVFFATIEKDSTR